MKCWLLLIGCILIMQCSFSAPEPTPEQCTASVSCPPGLCLNCTHYICTNTRTECTIIIPNKSGTTCCCSSQLLYYCLLWSCCPVPNAVCCPDRTHCCPGDLPVCDDKGEQCLPPPLLHGAQPPHQQMPWLTKQWATYEPWWLKRGAPR